MKKILAFGASTSSTSINVSLTRWAVSRLEGCSVNFIDLNDFEMPIFSIDREEANGIPEKAKQFKKLIEESDGILVSFAEHNGSFTAAFKNIFDWASRLEGKPWAGKSMFLMATSPGKRGGRSVLEHCLRDFPHRGAEIVADFSLPSYKQNFDPEGGIRNPDLLQSFNIDLAAFQEALESD